MVIAILITVIFSILLNVIVLLLVIGLHTDIENKIDKSQERQNEIISAAYKTTLTNHWQTLGAFILTCELLISNLKKEERFEECSLAKKSQNDAAEAQRIIERELNINNENC